MPIANAGRPKSLTKSARAGLVFPVSRVAKTLKAHSPVRRIAATASVFTAAVLEYVVAEVLDVAKQRAQEASRKRILPADLGEAVQRDVELYMLHGQHAVYSGETLKRVTCAGGRKADLKCAADPAA